MKHIFRKLLLPVFLSFCLLSSACSCAASSVNADVGQNGDSIPIGNPVRELEGPEDLTETGGHMEAPGGAEETFYAVISGEIAEIQFSWSDAEYCFRGAKGMDYETLCGVYADLEEWEPAAFSDAAYADAELRAFQTSENGRLAAWKAGDFTYTLFTASPVREDPFATLVLKLAEGTRG